MRFAAFSPVTIPVRTVRTALAVLAARDQFLSVGDGIYCLHLLHNPLLGKLLRRKWLAYLCDEVLYQISYLEERGKVLALQCVADGFRYQQDILCNDAYMLIAGLHKNCTVTKLFFKSWNLSGSSYAVLLGASPRRHEGTKASISPLECRENWLNSCLFFVSWCLCGKISCLKLTPIKPRIVQSLELIKDQIALRYCSSASGFK